MVEFSEAEICRFPLKTKELLSLFYLLACYYGNIYVNNSFHLQLYLNKVKDCILNIKAGQTFFLQLFPAKMALLSFSIIMLIIMRQALFSFIIGHGLKLSSIESFPWCFHLEINLAYSSC